MLSFLENYRLHHLARHAHEAGEWDFLFAQIETRDLLVRQAEQEKGFAQPMQDLERHVLPGTIALADWDRFIRYSLVAINLRGLAETLVEEEALRALARRNQIELARSLVAQLPDPARRAAARAVLADEKKDGDLRSQFLREVLDDLRALPTSGEEGSAVMLETVARYLGPELENELASLFGRFDQTLAWKRRLWLALADGCRKRDWGHPGVRRALREVEDPHLLHEALRGWLSEGAIPEPAVLREIGQELAEANGLVWMTLLTTLGRRDWSTSDEAWEAWEEQARQGPAVPWSPLLIETGGRLFARFTPSQADRLEATLEDPALRAAYRVVRLEEAPDEERTQKALAAVRDLQLWGERLCWTLRLLLAWREDHPGEKQERERLATSVAHALREQRYVAPADDLRRFLDLAAEIFPRELPRLLGVVMRAPETRPDTLTAIVETARSPAVLENLFAEIEAYALVVSPTEAEGFELRARLIVRLACRLCQQKRDPQALAEAAGRLLPEEQDDLYVAAARELADLVSAEELIGKIRSPRLKTATRLAVLGVTPGEGDFDPRSLYESVAVVEGAEEEFLALDLLAEPALDPESLVEGPLASINSKERQGQALIDLARTALELEEDLFEKGRRDPLAPLQLVRHSLSAVGSDERLAALTLDLLDLARYMEGPQAVTEFHEAVDVLALRLERLPWPARRDALEILLARIQPALLGRLTEMGRRKATVRCRGVAELIDAILDLPAKADDGPRRQALREGWHEILPAVFAAVERLPRLAGAFLAHPFRAWLWAQVLPELGQLFGWERMWRALGALEVVVPRGLRKRYRTRWAFKETAAFAKGWGWLTLEQREILEICLVGPEAWKKEAAVLSSAPTPSPQRLRTLALLLSGAEPERVSDLVARLPEGSDRDSLCLRLICSSRLPAKQAGLLSYVSGAAHRLEAEVCGAGSLKDEDRARALGELAGRHGREPSHPKAWPALRRLRTVANPETSKALAESLADSLPAGGREGGERAFRVWLNSHLSSRTRQDGRRQRAVQVRAAIFRALVFPSSRESKTQGEPDLVPAEPEGYRRAAERIYETWTRGRLRMPKRSGSALPGRIGLSLSLVLSLVTIPLDVPVNLRVEALLLHLAAWSGVLAHALAGARQTRAAGVSLKVLLVPSLLLLIPVPLVPLLGLFLYSLAIPTTAAETLVHALDRSAESMDRLPRWQILQEALRRSERKGPVPPRDPPDPGAIERRLVWLANLKAAVLVFDGAAMAWLVSAATDGRAAGLGIVALICSVLGAGGLATATFRRRPRERESPRLLASASSSLLLGTTELALATGLLLGEPLHRGEGSQAGEVLAVAALCGLAVSLIRLLKDAFRKGKDRSPAAILWALLFVYLAGVGCSMATDEVSREGHLFLLKICVVIFPWAVPLLAMRQFLDALLHPFQPQDILSRARSASVRRDLAVLLLSVALPLGGLIVPAWSRFRRRLQLAFLAEELSQRIRKGPPEL